MSATFVEIRPRELKDALHELDGISATTIDAHYRLYQGYVLKRNEILAKLADVDLEAGNQVYSDVRALKIDLTFAIGGIKNHEIYFDHLGGDGGNPTGAFGELIERDFGSPTMAGRHEGDRDGRSRLGLDGIRLGRGPALQLRRRRAEHVPVWNATPLVALDVYEHAYFLDYQTDRAAYIEAFFRNLDWGVVNGWIAAYRIPTALSR